MSMKPYTVTVERRFEQPPERVFDAWLDPSRVAKWFAPALGPMTTVEIDARVGGRFNFTQDRKGEAAVHVGEYKVIERPRKLVFTWATPAKATDPIDDASTVTVEIVPDGDGARLTLTHEMDPKWETWSGKIRHGWTTMLEGISKAP
jgi:uncharacterized protein YndB with AHSA1/START domain